MMKKMNKKGFGFIFLIVLGITFLVVSIFAGFFGLKLFQKAIDEVGKTTLIYLGVFILALAFRPFVQQLLMSLLSLVKAIFTFIGSIFR